MQPDSPSICPDHVKAALRTFSGREWIIPRISNWWHNDPGKILLLTGEPGAGKTMLSAWLSFHEAPLPADEAGKAQLMAIRNLVKAAYFCTPGTSPMALAKSFAWQLGHAIPEYNERLSSIPGMEISITAHQSGTVQPGGTSIGVNINQIDFSGLGEEFIFDQLVLLPLKGIFKSTSSEHILLVIDSLDEAATYVGATTLVKLLLKLAELPKQVRIIVTTRLDPRILKHYYKYPSINISEEVQNTASDIRKYLSTQLADQGTNLMVDKIANAAKGNFLYATLMAGSVLQNGISKMEEKSLPEGLGDIYKEFLNRELGGEKNEDRWYGQFKPLLGLICTAYGQGIEKKILRDIIGREVDQELRAVKQFLIGDLPNGPFRPFHKSFTDYLCSDEANIDYFIDASEMHDRIVQWLVSRFDGQWHICNLYGLQRLPSHILASSQIQLFEKLMADFYFIEARCNAGFFADVLSDFDRYYSIKGEQLADDRQLDQWYRFLSNKAHLLRAKPSLLLQEAINYSEYPILSNLLGGKKVNHTPAFPWLRKTAGRIFQHHSGQIISMTFWEDKRYLVVSTTAQEVWIWDTTAQKIFCRCETPPSAVKALAVSPDGVYLAGAMGAADPSPMIGGLILWTRDGKLHRKYDLEDWVYTLHWRSNTEIVAGTGMPQGSEAIGRLWRVNIEFDTCDEIGYALADRPFVFTCESGPESSPELFALAMDGTMSHITSDYVPMTHEELMQIEMQLWKDGDYNARDSMMAEKRPAVQLSCMPSLDNFGFAVCARMIGGNKLCFLGQPLIPPEFFAWQEHIADGLYFINLKSKESYRILFDKRLMATGFQAQCLAADYVSERLAIGGSDAQVYLYSPVERGMSISVLPRRGFRVTSLCFSNSGKELALGDMGAQIELYDLDTKSMIFQKAWIESPISTLTDGAGLYYLYRDRLEWKPISTGEPWVIQFDKGIHYTDFALNNGKILILGYEPNKDGTPGHQYIQVVNPESKALLATANVSDGSSEASVRIQCRDWDAGVFLGSVSGLVQLSLETWKKKGEFILPLEEHNAKEKMITVMRLGADKPNLSCELFALAPDGPELYCSYMDNVDHPRVSGQLRCWNERTLGYSVPQIFDSAISAMGATHHGMVAVGTEDGEASLWRYNGIWEKIGGIRHRVPVVAVACNHDLQLVCSASLDGAMIVWHFTGTSPFLETFIDCKPLSVGFIGQDIYMVDRHGQMHLWSICGT